MPLQLWLHCRKTAPATAPALRMATVVRSITVNFHGALSQQIMQGLEQIMLLLMSTGVWDSWWSGGGQPAMVGGNRSGT